jgi:hypothetical protein
VAIIFVQFFWSSFDNEQLLLGRVEKGHCDNYIGVIVLVFFQ